jgi:uncharacterized membrane protein YkgB
MQRKEYTAFIFAHIALFIVFVWFGALKIFGLSPAGPLVVDLFNHTLGVVLPFLSADTFMVLFGCFEVLIGILFVLPRMEKAAIALLIPHMITTMLPLFFLTEMTWDGMFTPSLEGQYIIKNVVIIALVATVFADMGKFRKERS